MKYMQPLVLSLSYPQLEPFVILSLCHFNIGIRAKDEIRLSDLMFNIRSFKYNLSRKLFLSFYGNKIKQLIHTFISW